MDTVRTILIAIALGFIGAYLGGYLYNATHEAREQKKFIELGMLLLGGATLIISISSFYYSLKANSSFESRLFRMENILFATPSAVPISRK